MPKVLLVEDEKAMNDLIALKFRVEGLEVDQAQTLTEAKERLVNGGPYNAILTDYLLPEGNSSELIIQARQSDKTKNIPIFLMTNYVEDINQDQMKQLGVNQIMVKYQVVPAQMVAQVKQSIPAG